MNDISGVVMPIHMPLMQEQPRADDIDEEETHLTEKHEGRPLFLTHCRSIDKSFIEMVLE